MGCQGSVLISLFTRDPPRLRAGAKAVFINLGPKLAHSAETNVIPSDKKYILTIDSHALRFAGRCPQTCSKSASRSLRVVRQAAR